MNILNNQNKIQFPLLKFFFQKGILMLAILMSTINLFGQNDNEKVDILYKLPKYLKWGEDDIKIGLLGASAEITKGLKKAEKKSYPYGKSIEIQTVLSPNDVAEFDNNILYISSKYNQDIESIIEKLKGHQTVIVTESWDNKKLLMVNFITENGAFKYQANKGNIKSKGVIVENSIDNEKGIILIGDKDLLDDAEQSLKNEKQKVKEQQEALEMQLLQLKYQKQKIERQTADIEEQKAKIQTQKDEIVASEKKINIQKQELNTLAEQGRIKAAELEQKTNELVEKEEAIKEQSSKLLEQEKKVTEQNEYLEKQNKEIEERQSRIESQKMELVKQGVTIQLQKNYLTISVVVLVIILTLVFFVLRASRVQKRQNILLAAQKEEIAIQASQLELANDELAQLSIVASETSNAVAILDPNGDFKWVNAGFTRMYGYTLQLLQHELGENIKKGSNYLEIADILETCINEKKPVHYETIVKSRTGEKLWAQTSLTPTFDNEGNISDIVLIDSDITVVKQAQAEIAEKNKKITDSILYAEKIQQAVLTPDEVLMDFVDEYFILFKPRDIVSGDFYWASKIGKKLVLVAADCTGHGVPGAFMSMLGISFLNEIIAYYNEETVSASVILDELRNKIKKSLRQTGKEGEAKDGMDMALCIVDKENMTIEFSGAQNPLILIRNGEVEIFKGDDQPIGIYHFEKPFTNEKIQIKHGDCFYIFSDGYADQFGQKTKKKFFIKRLREFFVKIHKEPFTEQHKILDDTFEKWRGTIRQMDDVLVIGMKVK